MKKNLQVRLADGVYRAIKAIAEERETTVTEVIRQALEVYSLGFKYAQQGRRLVWEDSSTGEKAELLIPGLGILPNRGSERKGKLELTYSPQEAAPAR